MAYNQITGIRPWKSVGNQHQIVQHFSTNEIQTKVKNLPSTLTKNEFFKLFKNCKDLTGHRMIMQDDKCSGIGYLSFKSEKAAVEAIQMLHGRERLSNGKFLDISIVERNKVFVKNLNEDVNWRILIHMFAEHGPIKSAEVLMHKRGFSRGYSSGRGIVHFLTSESASSAVANMDGRFVRGSSIRVEHYKSKYELKQEMFNTYFSREVPQTTTSTRCTYSVSGDQTEANVASDLPATLNDMAAVKQVYANKLSLLVQQRQPTTYQQITEILLELDNVQLQNYIENPILLQRKMEEVATLITIGNHTY